MKTTRTSSFLLSPRSLFPACYIVVVGKCGEFLVQPSNIAESPHLAPVQPWPLRPLCSQQEGKYLQYFSRLHQAYSPFLWFMPEKIRQFQTRLLARNRLLSADSSSGAIRRADNNVYHFSNLFIITALRAKSNICRGCNSYPIRAITEILKLNINHLIFVNLC